MPLIARLLTLQTAPLPFGAELQGLLARLTFAATLAGYFWQSALTKIDGFGLSVNAFAQIFPRQFEAAGYDASAMGLLAHLVVLAGTAAEFVLPLTVITGFLTRLSALGMIGFIVVMTLTDLFGHGVGPETIGALFDRHPDAPIADQRLLWLWVLASLTLSGGGYLSVDRLLGRAGAAPESSLART